MSDSAGSHQGADGVYFHTDHHGVCGNTNACMLHHLARGIGLGCFPDL